MSKEGGPTKKKEVSTVLHTPEYEELVLRADKLRAEGGDPNTNEAYKAALAALRIYEWKRSKQNAATDAEHMQMSPGVERAHGDFTMAKDALSSSVGYAEVQPQAPAEASPAPASLERLESAPQEVPVLENPIDVDVEKAKLKAAVEELQGVDDPHDSWDPKAFKKYEKAHATPVAKAKTPRKKAAATPAAPLNQEATPAIGSKDAGTDDAGAAAHLATLDAAAAPVETGKTEKSPKPQDFDTVDSEEAADFKRYTKKQEAAEKLKEDKGTPGVLVGGSYVPEGVKTNEQLKAEFFANRTKPQEKELVKSMAEQLYDANHGSEAIRRVVEGERAARMREMLGQRSKELDGEAGKKFGEGSGVMNFLRASGEKYNKLPLWSKIAIGAGLVGALAVSHGTGLAPVVYGALIGKRAWSGLGTFVKTENFLQRKSEQKESWWNKSAGGRALTGLAVGAGLAFGTSWGLNRLASWLATDTEWGKEANNWFKGEWGKLFGGAGGHTFDPNTTVEVRKGHGAISMIHDLKAKLEHLYPQGTDPSKIPAGAKAILEGNPTKLAEQLEAYQPANALNSERIPIGAHLGVASDGALIYEAHGMDNPSTLINTDGSSGAAWDDHMMKPGAHHTPVAHAPVKPEGQPMSVAEKSLVDEATRAAHQPITAAEIDAIKNNDYFGGYASPADMWHHVQGPDAFKALQASAGTMQPDAQLIGDLNAANVTEPTPYLLHDGRVAIFGGAAASEDELFAVHKAAAEHFASEMQTDVVIKPEGYGAPGEVVVHPDGTTDNGAPADTRSFLGRIFNSAPKAPAGPSTADVVMKLSR